MEKNSQLISDKQLFEYAEKIAKFKKEVLDFGWKYGIYTHFSPKCEAIYFEKGVFKHYIILKSAIFSNLENRGLVHKCEDQKAMLKCFKKIVKEK